MKVLLVNKFHYLKGGSETYYFALGKMLKEKGCDVIYFSMKDDKNIPCEQEKYFVNNIDFNAKMSPVKVITASAKLLYSLEAKRKFEKLLRDEKPDIIHLNIFQSQLTDSIIFAAQKHHIPIVYTAHDLKAVCPSYLMMNHGKICDRCINGNYWHCVSSKCMKNSRAKSLLAALEAETYRIHRTYDKMDLIICPSQHHQRRLAQGKICDPRILKYMPNFLPAGTTYHAGEPRGTYYLYYGRLSEEKGIMTLLQAFNKANVEKPLYIVGAGPQETELRDYIQHNMSGKTVKMLGYKTGDELKQIVSSAYCVILPSICCENAPYSIMESQAMGRPAIVSDNGGLPELVTEGVNGYIFHGSDANDLCSKLEKMEHSSFPGNEICQMAREKFSQEKYVLTLISEYKRLIKPL